MDNQKPTQDQAIRNQKDSDDRQGFCAQDLGSSIRGLPMTEEDKDIRDPVGGSSSSAQPRPSLDYEELAKRREERLKSLPEDIVKRARPVSRPDEVLHPEPLCYEDLAKRREERLKSLRENVAKCAKPVSRPVEVLHPLSDALFRSAPSGLKRGVFNLDETFSTEVECGLLPIGALSDGTVCVVGHMKAGDTAQLFTAKMKKDILIMCSKGSKDPLPSKPELTHYKFNQAEKYLRALYFQCGFSVGRIGLTTCDTFVPGVYLLNLKSPHVLRAIVHLLRVDPPSTAPVSSLTTYFAGRAAIVGKEGVLELCGQVDRSATPPFPSRITLSFPEGGDIMIPFDPRTNKFTDQRGNELLLKSSDPISGTCTLYGCTDLEPYSAPKTISPIRLIVNFVDSATNLDEMDVTGEGESDKSAWKVKGTYVKTSMACNLELTSDSDRIELTGAIQRETGDGIFHVVGLHNSVFHLHMIEGSLDNLKKLASAEQLVAPSVFNHHE